MATDGGGIDIGFQQLTYKVKTGILKRAEIKILNGVCGSFRYGELSAIIGPSGSGKTTILNILSGLTQQNFDGTLKTDESSNKVISNRSVYIMQNQMLHPKLTVTEAMSFAIKLKTGRIMTSLQQKRKCDAILKQLDLVDSADRLTKNLSGGERKRLSIAVELVSDPSILFLDEPTTGLDSLASSRFITFLGNLVKSGKTIICSIHAPSALMLDAFDHVYAIADGQCIYQGSSKNIIPFLDELNLPCPAFYNPADYLMEIATHQYGHLNPTLTEKVGNGGSDKYRREIKLENRRQGHITEAKVLNYSSSFTYQLLLLIQRNLLLMKRNKDYILMRIIVSVAMAIIVGVTFYDLGHLANHIFDNYKFIFNITQFLTYSAFLSLLVRFPTDIEILRSEYFNGWYSSPSYYVALTLADVPVLFAISTVFTLISYYMTGQPMEQHRILLFLIIVAILSSIAQAFGLLSSSIISDITISIVIGGFIVAVHVIFSGVLVLKKDVQPWMKWIFDIIFLNHANDGLVIALFGYNREKLQCDDVYCHFRDPREFLRLIDAPEDISFFSFLIIFVVVHVVTYGTMTMKLKRIN